MAVSRESEVRSAAAILDSCMFTSLDSESFAAAAQRAHLLVSETFCGIRIVLLIVVAF